MLYRLLCIGLSMRKATNVRRKATFIILKTTNVRRKTTFVIPKATNPILTIRLISEKTTNLILKNSRKRQILYSKTQENDSGIMLSLCS